MHLLWQNKGNLRDITVAYRLPSIPLPHSSGRALRNCPSGNVASEKCITGCWDPFKCWILRPAVHSVCRADYTPSMQKRERPRMSYLSPPVRAWERFRFHGETLGISVAIPATLAQCISALPYLLSSLPPCSLSHTIFSPPFFNLSLYHHPPLVLFLSLSSNDAHCDTARADRQRRWIWTVPCTYVSLLLPSKTVFVTFHNEICL